MKKIQLFVDSLSPCLSGGQTALRMFPNVSCIFQKILAVVPNTSCLQWKMPEWLHARMIICHYTCVYTHACAYQHKLVTALDIQRRQKNQPKIIKSFKLKRLLRPLNPTISLVLPASTANKSIFITKGAWEVRFTESPMLKSVYRQQSPTTDSCGNVSTNQSLALLLA